jgi:hypothetical protein
VLLHVKAHHNFIFVRVYSYFEVGELHLDDNSGETRLRAHVIISKQSLGENSDSSRVAGILANG